MSIPYARAPEARLRRPAAGQDRAPPTTPLLIAPGYWTAFTFADLDALAADIQARRRRQLGQPGLRLRRIMIGWGGYRTFQGFAAYWLYGDDEAYAFTCAAGGVSLDRLDAALRRAEPRPAPRRLGDDAPPAADLLIVAVTEDAA